MNKNDLDLCKRALYDVKMAEVARFEKLSENVPEHSPEFNEKMSELIEKMREKESSFARMNLKKILVSAAVTLLIALVLAACAFIPQIKGFFVYLFDDHITLKSDGDTFVIEQYYSMQVVPENYKQVDVIKTDENYFLNYEDGGDNCIVYEQMISSNSVTNIDASGDMKTAVLGDGTEIMYSSEKNQYSILWSTDDYLFFLSCPSSMPWEKVEQMLLGIKPE